MKYKVNSITGKTVNITLTRDDDTTFTTNVDGFPLGDEIAFEKAVMDWANAHVAGEEQAKKLAQVEVAPEITSKVGKPAKDFSAISLTAEVIE